MKTRFLLSVLLFAFAITGSGPVLARQPEAQCGGKDTWFDQILLGSIFADLEAMGYKFERDAGDCWLHVSTHFFANEDGRPTLATHFSLVMENGNEMQTTEMINKNNDKLIALRRKVEGVLSRSACFQPEKSFGDLPFDDPGGFIKAGGTLSYIFDLRSDPFNRRNSPLGDVLFEAENRGKDAASEGLFPSQPLGDVVINSCEAN